MDDREGGISSIVRGADVDGGALAVSNRRSTTGLIERRDVGQPDRIRLICTYQSSDARYNKAPAEAERLG